MLDPAIKLGVPRLFNLYDDPGERRDVFLPTNTWVRRPAMAAVEQFWISTEAHPLIAAGTPDPYDCLLYTSPSPRDATLSRMPSSA